MTKILLVSADAFSIYNNTLGLMRALRYNGYDVVAAAPEDGFEDRIEKEGFEFIALKNLDRKGTNPFKDVKLIVELYKIYRREKPSVVLHFTVKPNIYGAVAARLLNIKSVCSVTGLGYLFMKKNLLNIIAKVLYRYALSSAYRVVFQNSEDLNLFVENKITNESKALVTPGSGVDSTYFSPGICKDFQKKGGAVVFLLIARMLWDKGIGELVEASKIVKSGYGKAEFWLLGNIDKGNPSTISREQIKKWEDDGAIKYLGFSVDIRKIICNADVVVLPSYREGVPRCLLEAMAMEKPIITTDAAGCRETVEDGVNGLLVPTKDAKALAQAMVRMLEATEQERISMGKKGREKALREFDEKIVIEKYLEIIRGR